MGAGTNAAEKSLQQLSVDREACLNKSPSAKVSQTESWPKPAANLSIELTIALAAAPHAQEEGPG